MTVTLVCPGCGATNRVDPEKAREGLQPVCGRCRAALGAAPSVVDVTDRNFDEQVLGASVPVLLDVWAAWCAPCRGMEPIIHDIAASLAGRLHVAKRDVDHSPAVAERLRIQGVPALILFNAGREISRMIGARSRQEILGALAGVV